MLPMHVQKDAVHNKGTERAASKSAATAVKATATATGVAGICVPMMGTSQGTSIVPGTPRQALLLRMHVQRHTLTVSPILLAAAAAAASAEEPRQIHLIIINTGKHAHTHTHTHTQTHALPNCAF
jgi:hypothetical protein